jgi:hypothetical protein
LAKPKLSRQAIRDPETLAALPGSARAARSRALGALRHMRQEGSSLTRAARDAGTTAANVRRWTDGNVLRREGRTWTASKSDTLARFEPVIDPGTGQVRHVAVRSSDDASTLGRYHASLKSWMRGEGTPEESGLADFEGRTVTLADGTEIELVTDRLLLDDLDAQGALDVLEFES